MDLSLLAFETAPVGLVLTEQRVIKVCNLRFAQMLGYAREELLDRSFRMLYASTEEFARIRDVGLEPLKSDGVYSDERMMFTAQGEMLWCRFRAHSLVPEDPLARVVMSFAKISDRPTITVSARERQVLGGLGQGWTSKEIARDLGLSPRTIEDVRARLLKRFSVRNTAELVARLTYLNQ